MLIIQMYVAVRRTRTYLYVPVTYFRRCCSASCYRAVAAAAVLLLAATVRHREPDDAIHRCGLLQLITVLYLSSLKHELS